MNNDGLKVICENGATVAVALGSVRSDLIAAAPDLFRACEAALKEITLTVAAQHASGVAGACSYTTMVQLETAIRRAKGMCRVRRESLVAQIVAPHCG